MSSENQFGSSTGFKMKFLFPLLAIVALASATFIGGKYVDVKDDGTIFIKCEDGKQIYITKHYGPYGQKNIEVEVTGPNNFDKMYQFGYNNQVNYGNEIGYQIFNTFNQNNHDQYDILDVIFREYLGYIDEYTYQQLLSKVHKAVLNGLFDSRVLYVLQALAEDTKWDSLVSGHNFYGQVGGLLNKMDQQNKYGLGFFGKLFKGQGVYGQYYNQDNVDYFYNVLMKIFDRQVLKTILNQQQMFNQEMYGELSYEKMWDMIFSQQGIFDHQMLVQIINNKVLRNYFIQQGFFDTAVLDQILVTYKTEGVYDQYLFQRSFNTQVLKYFFINHMISVYDILGQTSYNQHYGNTLYSKGIYGYNKYFQQTPKITYNHLFGVYGNVPEYVNNMQMYGRNFLRNNFYGQQYYGYNQGPYNYEKYYSQYPLTQSVY